MSTLTDIMNTYASDPRFSALPEEIHAMSEMTDPAGKPALAIAFFTHRDIITHIGYRAPTDAPAALRACAAALCQLCLDKAVMAADLLSPEDIAKCFGQELDDESFYYAALAVLTLKNTLASFADYRARMLKAPYDEDRQH